jgi:hypothetical protein
MILYFYQYFAPNEALKHTTKLGLLITPPTAAKEVFWTCDLFF